MVPETYYDDSGARSRDKRLLGHSGKQLRGCPSSHWSNGTKKQGRNQCNFAEREKAPNPKHTLDVNFDLVISFQ
jgi:hypothetical protein